MIDFLANNIAPLSSPIWIDNDKKLSELVSDLLSQKVVAVDTEGDSLYSYFVKVCLIQLSTTEKDYLVDPFAVNISLLADFFKNPAIEKIFHAAEYDILSLKRDYQFEFSNIFDTMWAAKVLGWPTYGLGAILNEQFGIKLDKRFQRYNWGLRPLSDEAIAYAYQDTHYLLALRNIQLGVLAKAGCLEEAVEIFERQTTLSPIDKPFDALDFWRIKGAQELDSAQQAILCELFSLRDAIGRKLNKPVFKVIDDQTLVMLAKKQPQTKNKLRAIRGISNQMIQIYAEDILKVIAEGKEKVPPKKESRSSKYVYDNGVLPRYELIRSWRNMAALERGVEADVIMGNSTLMDIANCNPLTLADLAQISLLGKWQCKTYGLSILNELKKCSL